MPTFTRAYLTRRAHGVIQPGPCLGDVDDQDWGPRLHGLVSPCFVLSDTKVDGGSLSTFIVGELNDTDGWSTIFARWKTDKLDAQTISGTLNLMAQVYRSDDAATACFKVYAAVTVGDTNAIRGVLLNNFEDTGNLWGNTLRARQTGAQALSAVAASAGDRLLLEIMVMFPSNAPDDFETEARFRAGSTFGPGTPATDLTDASLSTTQAPWVDFSNAITTQTAVAAPANDACADATVIAAIPYDSGKFDASSSADTNKGVWWTWTADRTARMVLDSLGGNYGARLRVYTGSCGALSLISGTNRAEDEWVQRSQTITQFSATTSVQYWFWLTDNNLGVAGGVAQFHLYERKTPETGDIFIDAQHILVLRDHATTPFAVNASPDFYGNTPTGNAIDYSEVEMDDNNGGTHSGERLFCVMFGESPWLLEILDLTTLNYLEQEIQFQLLTGGDNPSSILFDRDNNVLVGFFGDNYDHLGVTATVPTADIQELEFAGADVFNTVANYGIEYGNSGSDYIEVASGQEIIWYTSADQTIRRYNRSTLTQLDDIAGPPAVAGPRPGLRTFRLLPPGDGSQGGLVTNGAAVHLVDGDGVIVTTYTPTPSERAQDLDKVEICNDQEHFIVSDQLSTSLFKFNIATGTQVWEYISELPTGQLCGFSIYTGSGAGLDEQPETPVEEEEEEEVECPIIVVAPAPPPFSRFGKRPRASETRAASSVCDSIVTGTAPAKPVNRF